jgi:hypothetical protein
MKAIVDYNCNETSPACVYPGDACHPSSPCPAGEKCLLLPSSTTRCGTPTPLEPRP